MASQASTSTPGSWQVNTALLLLRIASGIVFVYHGSSILFGAFGGPGPQAFAGFMHMPAAVGYLVGLAEFGGGLAMLSGVLLRVGAAGIMTVMAGAILLVHLPHGFSVGRGGMEYALTQFLLALALFITGAGSYSLGRWLPPPLRWW